MINQNMQTLMTGCGYTLQNELQSSMVYVKGSTTVCLYDGKILINGPKAEHTIDTRTLDVYDVMLALHALNVVAFEGLREHTGQGAAVEEEPVFCKSPAFLSRTAINERNRRETLLVGVIGKT